MTTTLTTFEEEKLDEFDQIIQERILNEDNPQYVLGWNACRYLSRNLLFSSLHQQREMMREEIGKADIADDKVGTFQEGYRCLREQILYFLSNKEI